MQEKVSGKTVEKHIYTDVLVQYHPDQNDVGIGLELSRSVPGLGFIDVLFGDVETQTEIGKILAERLQKDFGYSSTEFASNDGEAEYMNRLGRACLDAVTGSKVNEFNNSLWAWFDRPAVNRLIRLLRKARDTSFGPDA